jgi:hypothetical protein
MSCAATIDSTTIIYMESRKQRIAAPADDLRRYSGLVSSTLVSSKGI